MNIEIIKREYQMELTRLHDILPRSTSSLEQACIKVKIRKLAQIMDDLAKGKGG